MTNQAVEEILDFIPIDQLASELGVDQATAVTAARQATASLLGGVTVNAQDEAESVATALDQHTSSDLFGFGGIDLEQVDTADGAKIVQHIFGSQAPAVSQAIGSRSQADTGIIAKLLPILAPIVMAYLAKRVASSSPSTTAEGPGSILGDLLGGVLGGGGSGGGGLADVLGSILGGTTAAPAASAPSPVQGTTGGVFSVPDAPPDTDLHVDDQPAAPQAREAADGGNLLSDILGGLFRKH